LSLKGAGAVAALEFFIVDVFAKTRYTGNQLAVVTGASSLKTEEMQRIAKEMNYSETTFVLSEEERDGGYDVRIFTPERELPFAGHPTLGTAYVIGREMARGLVSEVVLNLGVGQIPVSLARTGEEEAILWMRQVPPTFLRILDSEPVCGALGIARESVDERFPVEEVTTGVPFIIVPLKNLESLKKAKIVPERYLRLVENTEAKAILVFCPETHEEGNDLSARVFAGYLGVPEDPATGSANGCLAGYLVKHRYVGKDNIDVRVEQGYEIGRPSLLLVRAEDRRDKIDVSVGGRVIMVAKGQLT
jgi:trans-2,3-dihydro-3-hydroxyanthranilate isomerase